SRPVAVACRGSAKAVGQPLSRCRGRQRLLCRGRHAMCVVSVTGTSRTQSQSSSQSFCGSQDHDAPQGLSLPRGALAFAASFIWLSKVLSGFGGAFSCFGFLISRLLRFCPLAIAERPFDE